MLPNRSGSSSQENDSGSLEDHSEFENSTSRSSGTESHSDYYPDSAEKAILKQKKTGYLWSGYAEKLKRPPRPPSLTQQNLISQP